MRSSTSTSRRIPIRRRPSSRWLPSFPALGRGGRAPGHHSAGSDPGRHARPEDHAQPSRCSACRTCATSSSTAIAYEKARQEVINRLQFVAGGCRPASRRNSRRNRRPARSFATPSSRPRTQLGRDIYTLNDLKALQDWVLEREFRRVPRIIDVTSTGGTVKRYEIHPDPDRLRATASPCSSCSRHWPTATPTSAATS